MLKVKCENCNKEFERYKNYTTGKIPRFCSQKCFYNWQKKHLGCKGGKIKIKCETCKSEIFKWRHDVKQYHYNFCSQKCHHKWEEEFHKGINNGNWKGGKRLCKTLNRWFIYKPNHPRSDGRYVYETILIAEKILNRPLKYFGKGNGNNEVVHHIDRNPSNDAYLNLLICTKSYEMSLHHRLRKRKN